MGFTTSTIRTSLAGLAALAGAVGLMALASESSLAATVYEEGLQELPMALPSAAGADLVDRNGNGVSDGLEARMGGMRGNDVVDVIVSFSGSGNAASAARAVGPFEVTQEFTIIQGFAATMTVGQARALAGTPGVFRVEEVFELSANMETARRDFGVDAVQLGQDGLTSLEGAGIGICIVDSGVRPTHVAFNGPSGLRIVSFMNALTNSGDLPGEDAIDDYGHGTLVAGIAAGDGDGLSRPDGWDALLRGVAPKADLYIAKALGSSGSGSSTDVIQGVQWCANQAGVDVINLSLGSDASSDGGDSVSQAVNNAVIAGKVVVVSAGNSGPNPYTIGSPAAAEKAITVGAVADWSEGFFTHSDKGGVYTIAFSSRGPTADDRTKPDIMAPGVDIGTSYNRNDTDYVIVSGTSMSAPFVSGVVALMLQADGGLLTHQVREILYNTAQDRGDATNGPEKDNDYGFGLIDVRAAVGAALGLPPPQTSFPSYSTGTDEITNSNPVSIPIDVSDVGSAPLNVVLLLDGAVECGLQRGKRCLGFEWRPDLDAQLLDPSEAQADLSTCMLDSNTECGAADSGRQETLIVPDPVQGEYTLNVFMGTNDRTGGQFRYEVSTGGLVVGQVNNPPITIEADIPPPPPPPPVNNAPVANDDSVATELDTLVTIDVLANDNDADDDTLSVVNVPAMTSNNGTLSVNVDQTIAYTPASGFTGTDTFTYKANDGTVDSNTATVSVSVAAPPPPPSGMHIAALDGSSDVGSRKWTATVTITVRDESDGLVDGATVSASWSDGAKGKGSCTTNASGQCAVSKGGLKLNVLKVTLTVTDVALGSNTYDSGSNEVTTIDVSQ